MAGQPAPGACRTGTLRWLKMPPLLEPDLPWWPNWRGCWVCQLTAPNWQSVALCCLWINLLNHPWCLLQNGGGRSFFLVLVLALGYAWGQPANPPNFRCLSWLLCVHRAAPHIQENACSWPYCPHVVLFIYPFPCLLSFMLSKTTDPPARRWPSSALSRHLVALKWMKPQPQRHLQAWFQNPPRGLPA